MRTRTKLTTPPGSEPAPLADEPEETYAPALAPPDEPRYPGRWRRVTTPVVALALLAAVGWLVFRAVTAGQAQDPSLQIVPDETATAEP